MREFLRCPNEYNKLELNYFSVHLTMKNIFYIEPYIVFYALFYTPGDSLRLFSFLL